MKTAATLRLQALRAGQRALLILVTGGAARADGADDFALDHERHAARGGEYARQRRGRGAALVDRIGESARRAPVGGGGPRLAYGDVGAGELRVFHLLVVHQGAVR